MCRRSYFFLLHVEKKTREKRVETRKDEPNWIGAALNIRPSPYFTFLISSPGPHNVVKNLITLIKMFNTFVQRQHYKTYQQACEPCSFAKTPIALTYSKPVNVFAWVNCQRSNQPSIEQFGPHPLYQNLGFIWSGFAVLAYIRQPCTSMRAI